MGDEEGKKKLKKDLKQVIVQKMHLMINQMMVKD